MAAVCTRRWLRVGTVPCRQVASLQRRRQRRQVFPTSTSLASGKRHVATVTDPGVWKWAGGRAPFARVWWGIPGTSRPPEKNWIWDWQICSFPLSWRAYFNTCTLQSLLIDDILSRSQFLLHHTSPSPFLCKFGQITRPTFSKLGVYIPRDLPWLPAASLYSNWRLLDTLTISDDFIDDVTNNMAYLLHHTTHARLIT